MSRHADLDAFYDLLERLESRVGGRRRLADCTGRLQWPQRGVYFVFEADELREDGRTPRVVRVGTHALKAGAKSTLWGRLRQHRGGGRADVAAGNHRGSVFRLHVGEALIGASAVADPPDTWARPTSSARDVRAREQFLESLVSGTIGAMSVLWLAVPDEPGPNSFRGVLERNAIALLSNDDRSPIDSPSSGWLGRHARASAIRSSGLWNVNHIQEGHDGDFLEGFARAIESVHPSPRGQSAATIAAEDRGRWSSGVS